MLSRLEVSTIDRMGGHVWSCFYMSDVGPVAAARCDGAHGVPGEVVG